MRAEQIDLDVIVGHDRSGEAVDHHASAPELAYFELAVGDAQGVELEPMRAAFDRLAVRKRIEHGG